MNIARPALVAATLAIASLTFVGCKSDEEKIQEQSMAPMSKSDMTMKADKMIADGQATGDNDLIAKGQAMKTRAATMTDAPIPKKMIP